MKKAFLCLAFMSVTGNLKAEFLPTPTFLPAPKFVNALPCGKTSCDCGCQDGKVCRCAENVSQVEEESDLHKQWRKEGFKPVNGVWIKTEVNPVPASYAPVVQPTVVPVQTYYQPTQTFQQSFAGFQSSTRGCSTGG